jgi:hypothetical protein
MNMLKIFICPIYVFLLITQTIDSETIVARRATIIQETLMNAQDIDHPADLINKPNTTTEFAVNS